MFYLECGSVQYSFVLFLNAVDLHKINLFQGKIDVIIYSLWKAFPFILLTFGCRWSNTYCRKVSSKKFGSELS